MADISRSDGFAFGNQTVADTALALADFTAFDSDDVDRANSAIITVRSGSINIRWDGGDPTTSTGHIFSSGDTIELVGNNNLQNLSIIRDGSTSAVVDVTLGE